MSAAEVEDLFCSFCGRSQHEVAKLVSGPGIYICDTCIALAEDIVVEAHGTDEEMLSTLRRLTRESDCLVEELRRRGVPWERISQAMRDEEPS
jgi:hypothetical protein